MFKHVFKTSIQFAVLTISLLFSFAAHAETQALSALLHNSNDPVAGNPKGKVTVVEFFDYQCSHCLTMSPVISSIIKSNPNVRVVFKEFPIRGSISLFASRAALAANKQEKYIKFSHALLESTYTLNGNNILDIARKEGLNMKQLKREMNSVAITQQIQDNYQLARLYHITGTPAFFIGKTDATDQNQLKFVLGEMSRDALQDAINQASA